VACVATFNVLLPGATVAEDTRGHPALGLWDAGAINRALAGAEDRLREPECQKVLDDFTDRHGRSLRQKLDELGVGPSEYLRTITFRGGSALRICDAEHVLMAAYPGRPTVYVCAARGRGVSRLALSMERNLQQAEHAVIHEMLHTLGLGENPPTSSEITRHVRRRCDGVTRRAAR
jgi:hypothetical protein